MSEATPVAKGLECNCLAMPKCGNATDRVPFWCEVCHRKAAWCAGDDNKCDDCWQDGGDYEQ